VPAADVSFRSETNWDSVYVKWDAFPIGEDAGGLEMLDDALQLEHFLAGSRGLDHRG
jgi:hypothetical protein